MSRINAYLSFEKNCREAMAFYQGCFGGELEMMIIGETEMKEHMPPETHNNVMHASLRNGDMVLMASEMKGPDGYHKGTTISLAVECGVDQVDDYYNYLKEGGAVACELQPTFWSPKFATVIDKFGITWILNSA